MTQMIGVRDGAKESGGAMWYQGEIGEADQFNKVNVESRVMYEGTRIR